MLYANILRIALKYLANSLQTHLSTTHKIKAQTMNFDEVKGSVCSLYSSSYRRRWRRKKDNQNILQAQSVQAVLVFLVQESHICTTVVFECASRFDISSIIHGYYTITSMTPATINDNRPARQQILYWFPFKIHRLLNWRVIFQELVLLSLLTDAF